jgi:hypothetical protein
MQFHSARGVTEIIGMNLWPVETSIDDFPEDRSITISTRLLTSEEGRHRSIHVLHTRNILLLVKASNKQAAIQICDLHTASNTMLLTIQMVRIPAVFP